MITVQTASRLHFGLLSLAEPGQPWPDSTSAARRFGGVGLMVQDPALHLQVEPCSKWCAEGPLADRALAFAHRLAENLGDQAGPPQRLSIRTAPPEHVGLGVGTQLGLAVGSAVCAAWRVNIPITQIARLVGRGRRSALGVHGFSQGGFLVEGGKGTADDIAPLVATAAVPPDWRIVLVRPTAETGVHGAQERHAFAHAQTTPTDVLCRLVLLGMLPALHDRDLDAFGAALYEFNVRAGEPFASVQKGIYASPCVSQTVAYLRDLGVKGVGQTSWGPIVFAVLPNVEDADAMARRVRDRFNLAEVDVVVTSVAHSGAQIGL
jgi:beta-RFAP synthase